jgi:hypothetical protein
MPVNVEAANGLGIQTILFKNPKDCEKRLLLINKI